METPTYNTITTVIASSLEKELDEPFRRLLAFKVDTWRATLVGRSLEKTPAQRRLYTQQLVVNMEKVALNLGNPCIGDMSRSIKDIPTPMRIGTTLFDYVGAVDGNSVFGTAVVGTVSYLTSGKYSRNVIYAEYVNRRLRVAQNQFLPKMKVVGVWDSPLEVFLFNGVADPWNEPYPVTGDMTQMITQYILTVDYQRPVTPGKDEKEVEVSKQLATTNG